MKIYVIDTRLKLSYYGKGILACAVDVGLGTEFIIVRFEEHIQNFLFSEHLTRSSVSEQPNKTKCYQKITNFDKEQNYAHKVTLHLCISLKLYMNVYMFIFMYKNVFVQM